MKNFILITVLFFQIALNAQTNYIKTQADTISVLFNKVVKAQNDEEKIKINQQIINLFKKLLQDKESFDYSFLELKFVSKLIAEDNKLKIYTWNIAFQNGEFQYFGFVQLKQKDETIHLIELADKSKKINQAENKSLNANNWYGALYYKILNNSYNGKTYYTLLAWDGNDNFTNKKIIEILTIKNKKLQFGSPIIKINNNEIKKRLIFEYSEQAKMMLRYDEKIKMIVFDHLAPEQKKFTGQYMYYGPDLSQDGLLFKDGFWILKENLDLRNPDNNKNKKPIKTSF